MNESAQQRQMAFDLFSAGRSSEWRNRLIWGDKKYVLPSLLEEFSGKIDLIYVDPPFDTGADFSLKVSIEEEKFTKKPSMIEQKAYRDTWGDGLASYLKWLHDSINIFYDLLSEKGSLYLHLDYRTSHYAKIILDEVFGAESFLNEVIWAYRERGISKNCWNRKHDVILVYVKNDGGQIFNFEDVLEPYREEYLEKFKYVDAEGRRYQIRGRNIQGSPVKQADGLTPEAEEKYPGLTYRQYMGEGTLPLDWWEISLLNKSAHERTGYPTQKPEALLERIIKASSNEDSIVLDCFSGSGTTAAVAEKLNRRWIACDLGRFAVHTTRKRLLSIENVKPFIVQNLGKYERQAWQEAQFGDPARAAAAVAQYRHFILDLYHARPIDGYTRLHGLKNGRMVHIGPVDSPISPDDVRQIAIEFRKAVGSGKDAPSLNAVDVLGWDFAFELNEVARQQAEQANIDMRFIRIPREVLEKAAVEQGDIKFFELAALSVDMAQKGREVTLKLTDFVIPPDDVPEDVQRAISKWSQWIDYWAVDWDNKGDTFHNMWQTYRTRQDKKLQLQVAHKYTQPGDYTILIKVIDILGNDTTKTLQVSIH